jgi:hypothetical protein
VEQATVLDLATLLGPGIVLGLACLFGRWVTVLLNLATALGWASVLNLVYL